MISQGCLLQEQHVEVDRVILKKRVSERVVELIRAVLISRIMVEIFDAVKLVLLERTVRTVQIQGQSVEVGIGILQQRLSERVM